MRASPDVILAKPTDTAFVFLKALDPGNNAVQTIPSIQEHALNQAAICYVAVNDGEVLSLQWEFSNIESQYVDLVVGGILRYSVFKKRELKRHRGEFTHALHKSALESGKISKLLACNLVVEARNSSKDIRLGDIKSDQFNSRPAPDPDGDSLATHNTPQSEVGTIEVRVLRKSTSMTDSTAAADKSRPLTTATRQARSIPTYEKKNYWWSISQRVEQDQIGEYLGYQPDLQIA
jgi:hypothetical protein